MSDTDLNIDPKGYSFYDVIGASEDSPVEEIRKLSEKAIKEAHPDFGSELNPEEFERVKTAKEILTSDDLRRQYTNSKTEIDVKIEDVDGNEIDDTVHTNQIIKITPQARINIPNKNVDIIIKDGSTKETYNTNLREEISHKFTTTGEKEISIRKQDEFIDSTPVRYTSTSASITVEERKADELSIQKIDPDEGVKVEETVRFKVTYEGIGAGISGAEVFAGTAKIDTTDRNGEFEYTPNTPGEVTLTVEARDNSSGRYGEGEITIYPQKKIRQLNISLNTQSDDYYKDDKIEVHVEDDEGNDIKSADVKFKYQTKTVTESTRRNGTVTTTLSETGSVSIVVDKASTRKCVYKKVKTSISVEDPVTIELKTEVKEGGRFSSDKIHISATFPDIPEDYNANGFNDVVSITVIKLAEDGRKMGVELAEDIDISQTIETEYTPSNEGKYRIRLKANGYRTVTDEVEVSNVSDDKSTPDQTSDNNENNFNTKSPSANSTLDKISTKITSNRLITDGGVMHTPATIYRSEMPRSKIIRGFIGLWISGVLMMGITTTGFTTTTTVAIVGVCMGLLLYPSIGILVYSLTPLSLVGNYVPLQGIHIWGFWMFIPVALYLYIRKGSTQQ